MSINILTGIRISSTNTAKIHSKGRTFKVKKLLMEREEGMEIADGLNVDSGSTKGITNHQQQILAEADHSEPEPVYASEQPGGTHSAKNPGPISKLLQKIGNENMGINFYKLAFGLALGMLALSGCKRDNPDPPVPPPEPEPRTAYVDAYARELHGNENITGVAVELWQNGKKEAEGTLNDGHVRLKLTKDFITNKIDKYDFGYYEARFVGNGYVDVVSPNLKVLVTEGGSTEMEVVEMVNESDIDVPNYRYAWRLQKVNERYEGPSRIVVNINRTDWDGTGKEFSEEWMRKFREFYVSDGMPGAITGFIEGVEYDDDTNVVPGDPGKDGVFNNHYSSTSPSAGSRPYPGSTGPVLRTNCEFNPEKIPKDLIYNYILHAFVDSLIRKDQDDFTDWLKKCEWTFGRPNGSELYEGYNGLPGWVEVIDAVAAGLVRGYTLMTLNPDYREVDRYTFDPLRDGILNRERKTKYEFMRIEPEEGRHTREDEGGRKKIRK